MADTFRKYYHGTRFGTLHVQIDPDAGTTTLLDDSAIPKPVLKVESLEKEDVYKAISAAKQFVKAKASVEAMGVKILNAGKLPENYYFPSSNVSEAKKGKPRR